HNSVYKWQTKFYLNNRQGFKFCVISFVFPFYAELDRLRINRTYFETTSFVFGIKKYWRSQFYVFTVYPSYIDDVQCKRWQEQEQPNFKSIYIVCQWFVDLSTFQFESFYERILKASYDAKPTRLTLQTRGHERFIRKGFMMS
ncbi:hypothetical protein HYC85_015208, partial [Camellia sinensis]